MKRYRKLCGIVVLAVFTMLAGCHHGRCATKLTNVVAATFPVWLFAANVCAQTPVNLELLIPAAVGCPHDFALKPADLQKLAKADAVIINGAGLEEFLTKPLASLTNKPAIIDAGNRVPVLATTEHGIDHVNPHIFASPLLAVIMVRNIADSLAEQAPELAAKFNANAEAYIKSLEALGEKFKHVGEKASNRGIALEHDALDYLAAGAGLTVVANLENSASASQLAALKKLLLEKKPRLLAGDAQYSDRLLAALAQETGLPYAKLDPCASGPENAPLDYYQKVMASNLETLEKHFE